MNLVARAALKIFGRHQVSLGYSTSESGAAQIYDREALRMRGSGAQLNFPVWSLSDAAAAATAPGQDKQVRPLRWHAAPAGI